MADNPEDTTRAAATTGGSQTSRSNSESEKPQATVTVAPDLERAAETDGYILDESRVKETYGISAESPLKKSGDGKVLIPQPTDAPEDPLNWPRWKKAAILIVLAANAFTSDYSAATGASALLPQAEQWRISPDEVNHATAG